jgi:hypothetical protein
VLARPGFKGTIAASSLGANVKVAGKYVEFTVTTANLGVTNWTLTGAPNVLDLTGGKRIVVFASKTPNHRGLSLTSSLTAELKDTDLVISRTGPGLSMKIQAKDCASGGIFRWSPSAPTRRPPCSPTLSARTRSTSTTPPSAPASAPPCRS